MIVIIILYSTEKEDISTLATQTLFVRIYLMLICWSLFMTLKRNNITSLINKKDKTTTKVVCVTVW